jgi:glycosyltransferase involved in cell wall biosynthesis
MKRVIDAYQIGIAIPADSISEFEIALQYISEIPVDEMAQNLNKAAQELNWENQEKLYIDLVKDLINK